MIHAGPEARDGAGTGWEAVRSEHRALNAMAERLETRLAELASGASDRVEETGLSELFDAFRGRLLEHMAAEERNQILERAATAAPRLVRRCESLLREHGDLRSRVQALAEKMPGRDWADLRQRFVEFRDALGAHESAENEVIQDAYLDDIGGRG